MWMLILCGWPTAEDTGLLLPGMADELGDMRRFWEMCLFSDCLCMASCCIVVGLVCALFGPAPGHEREDYRDCYSFEVSNAMMSSATG